MKRIRLFCIFYLATFVISAGCGHILYADGPYYGKVIDSETKQPIEGAAVVAVWRKQSPSVGHYTVTYYDAQETVTDQAGNFTIPGISGGSFNPLAEIREPLFTIFRPAYEVYDARRLPRPDNTGISVLKLRHLLTREERQKNLVNVDVFPDVPRDKYPNFIKLKISESADLGLTPKVNPSGGQQ